MPNYLQSTALATHSNSANTSESSHKDFNLTPRGKRFIPSKIGNSQESPTYMRTQHGKISTDTYANPFLPHTISLSGDKSLQIMSPTTTPSLPSTIVGSLKNR